MLARSGDDPDSLPGLSVRPARRDVVLDLTSGGCFHAGASSEDTGISFWSDYLTRTGRTWRELVHDSRREYVRGAGR